MDCLRIVQMMLVSNNVLMSRSLRLRINSVVIQATWGPVAALPVYGGTVG